MNTTTTSLPLSESNLRLVRRILAAYNLATSHVLPPQKGYRNTSYPVVQTDGSVVNLILYKSEPGVQTKITDADTVASKLTGVLPIRQQIDPRIICLQTGQRRKYGALYNYLPGETIPWEAYTKTHIKLLGQTMSDLHHTLQPFGKLTSGTVTQEYTAIVARMQRYFAQSGVQKALQTKLSLSMHLPAYFGPLLAQCASLPHQQTLHMDLVRGNILFGQPKGSLEVTGILDFEKTTHGHPLFDIARTLAFLLVDCKYTPEDKVRKYFLHSGYHKRGRTNLPQVQVRTHNHPQPLLEMLLDLFLTYDFYKFLRHNPYESLPYNEHFARTRALLARRGIIS